MDRAPLIGITCYGPEPDGLLRSFSLPQGYVDAVAAAGGVPVLLAASSVPVESVLGAISGLIVAGGGDIAPAAHAGGAHDTVYMVNPERDDFELSLVRAALARQDLPVLGICRGMQVINVVQGGDLVLHLPEVYGDGVDHRLPPREPCLHTVRVERGSELERLVGETEFPVCSWHHQGVRRLGRDLRAIAHAPDGVIEAIVHEAHPWALGVQWHPEMQLPGDVRQARLFETLVAQARAFGRLRE